MRLFILLLALLFAVEAKTAYAYVYSMPAYTYAGYNNKYSDYTQSYAKDYSYAKVYAYNAPSYSYVQAYTAYNK